MTRRPDIARQKGLALLLVIFFTALVTVAVTAVIKNQGMQANKSGNRFLRAQAIELALAAEQFARVGLRRDLEKDKEDKKQIDHNKEIWAQYAAAFPMELGTIELQVDDLQGRLNINDLVTTEGKVQPEMLKRLENLISVLGVTSVTAEKVLDWIDQDDESHAYKGAEEGVYLGYEIPYRTPNFPMADVTELMLIDGITYEDYMKLLPYVTVLPPGSTGLNVNTCAKALIRALDEKITDEQAESVIERRNEDPFAKADEIFQLDTFAGFEGKPGRIVVSSHFFQVAAKVTINDKTVRMVSVVYRDGDGKTTVLSRSFGKKDIITKQQVVL